MPLSVIKIVSISPNVKVVLYAIYREETCKFEISNSSVPNALQIGGGIGIFSFTVLAMF